MEPRLKEIITKEINPSLKEKFGYKNLYMGPKIEKIVVNMGLGLDGNDTKIISSCQEDLGSITGQRPVITKFRKSIANFKTRKNTKTIENHLYFVCTGAPQWFNWFKTVLRQLRLLSLIS